MVLLVIFSNLPFIGFQSLTFLRSPNFKSHAIESFTCNTHVILAEDRLNETWTFAMAQSVYGYEITPTNW